MDERAHSEKGPGRGGSWSGEAGARWLLACVRDAGSRGHDLPTRLEAGLRAALGLRAREPDLARLLTVEPRRASADRDVALAAPRRWLRRLARLLREAAGGEPALRAEGAAGIVFARLTFVGLPSIDDVAMRRAEAALDVLADTLLASPPPSPIAAEADRRALAGLLEAALAPCP